MLRPEGELTENQKRIKKSFDEISSELKLNQNQTAIAVRYCAVMFDLIGKFEMDSKVILACYMMLAEEMNALIRVIYKDKLAENKTSEETV